MAGPRRLMSMASLACYVILAVAATAPHAHDLPSSSSIQDGAALAWSAGTADPGAAGGIHRSGECRLCSWQRWSARELREEGAGQLDLPSACSRPDAGSFTHRDPRVNQVLLRAPPAV